VRASIIDVLDSEYIQLAMLKGLRTYRILFRHALPNAVVPAIQAAATVFAYSVGGVVVVEYVFGFPGIGTGLTDAVGNRDIPVVQFIVLLIAVTFFCANICADILAAVLTPPGRGGRR
jgi:peptide/nickel transport system permease protein